MNLAVVDTSALARLYIPDGPVPRGLEEVLDAAWRGEALLLAPELALAEIGQVLRKKEHSKVLSSEKVDEIMLAVLDLPIQWIGHAELIERAIAHARKDRLTVYDGLFLALALDRGALLFSGDAALVAAYKGSRGR